MSARIGRGLLGMLLIVLASSASACDEPNEPNAIQPSDFMRSGEEIERSREESRHPLVPAVETRDEAGDSTDDDDDDPSAMIEG